MEVRTLAVWYGTLCRNPNTDGLPPDRQIPTILSYVDGDEYYGTQAKNFLIRNSDNTIAYFKDFLGKE